MANSTAQLVLHSGGCRATEKEVRAIKTPAGRDRWKPIGHAAMLDAVYGELKKRKLLILRKDFGLNREGGQMFGVLDVGTSKNQKGEFGVAIGVRSCIDRSIASGLAFGGRVFVCDNLAFTGDVTLNRKNTTFSGDDIPVLITEAMDRYKEMANAQAALYAKFQKVKVDDAVTHDIILSACKKDVIPSMFIMPLVKAWDDPEEFVASQEEKDKAARKKLLGLYGQENAWSLFNMFTHFMKRNFSTSMVAAEEKTRMLTGMFRDHFAPDGKGKGRKFVPSVKV